MGTKNKATKVEGREWKNGAAMGKKETKEHVGTLKRLEEKDPEFYEFLKEHDKELLEFDEEDMDDNTQTDVEEEKEEAEVDDTDYSDGESVNEGEPSKNVITSEMFDTWCNAIQDGPKLATIRSILGAFRSACHYGDDSGDDPSAKFSTMSSSVFNKIMLFVLNEMDGILRELMKFPASGGKKEMIMDLIATRRWKNYNHLVKSYLGNSLHVLNQMTDNEMIGFMLKRLKYSSIFLAAFPALLRKYIKVALHFWGTGSGALPVASFLFLRDVCVRIGPDCLDDCIRGMYKAYVMNCQFINSAKLQHIQFLSNCFIELLRVDIPSAYQHAFGYIRQLAMILKEALSCSVKKKNAKNKGKVEPSSSKKNKGKDAPSNSVRKETFRKVYKWKYVNCLELWTGVVCAYSSEPDLRPLAYPLTQIITGVARLVPSTCYFPLRLRCVKMLNRISASTGMYIPISTLLLDMLEIKELHRPPTGGVGKAVDWLSILKVSKPALKTRAFQEACVFSVVEELTEHLSQWSYSIGFMELSFVPSVRLRDFCKSTKVDRFRREIRHFIRQIEANSDYVNKKRSSIPFLPNSSAAASFLEDDKTSGKSPLSQYAAILIQRAQERNDSLMESSVLVGDRASKFGSKIPSDDEYDDSEDEAIPKSSFTVHNAKPERQKNVKRKKIEPANKIAHDEDIVEDLVLSSDEDDELVGDILDVEEYREPEAVSDHQQNRKGNRPIEMSKKKSNGKPRNTKSKKRKRAHRRDKKNLIPVTQFRIQS